VTRSPVPPSPAGASAQPTGRPTLDASQHGNGGSAPSSVRAQRITTFLMLVSASIVSLALIGQATRFDRRFITFALVLLGMVIMIGTLTQMRLGNAAIEDLAHVIGMNRLRAAYVELDPGIERYLVTSAHDDDPGIWQTYNHLMGPNPIWQPFASSTTFITLVNAGLTGVFAGLVAVALDAPGPLVGAAAAGSGLAYLGISATLAVRQVGRMNRRYVSLFPASSSNIGGGDSQAVAEDAQA
jgi:hypothetical protein